MKNLKGMRSGRLIAIRPTDKRLNNQIVWQCRCDCGNEAFIRGSSLTSKDIKSCGCLRRDFGRKSLAGKRFGRLTVVKPTGESRNRSVMWECLCDCGNRTFLPTPSLTTGNTRSCGCLHKEQLSNQQFVHGESLNGETRLYQTWKNMRGRCHKINSPDYKNYGGRGITVCKEWDSFISFKDWAALSGYRDPSPHEEIRFHLTIDRIDNDGNYEPSNCHWITKSENSIKANVNRKTFDGAI